MAKLSGLNLLIVDTPSFAAWNLRACLTSEGAHVHVVCSPGAALKVVDRERIHTAFVAYSPEEPTLDLCEKLSALKIPHIFVGCSPPVARPRLGPSSYWSIAV